MSGGVLQPLTHVLTYSPTCLLTHLPSNSPTNTLILLFITHSHTRSLSCLSTHSPIHCLTSAPSVTKRKEIELAKVPSMMPPLPAPTQSLYSLSPPPLPPPSLLIDSTTRSLPPVCLVVKASALRAEDPGFEPACAGIFPIESYQRLKNWNSPGYPARRLAL